MPAELLEAPHAPVLDAGGGSPPSLRHEHGRGDGGPELFGDPDRFGVLAFLGTISMLFIGFTSAYIVRRTGSDWAAIEPHPLLWLNSALLLGSSAMLELARSAWRAGRPSRQRGGLVATGVLGVAFLAGQYALWQALAARGVFLASNPHSSFFYLLTGLHGLHLVGGLVWFGVRVLSRGPAVAERDPWRLFALYWHFLAALWLYLLLLLFVL